MEECSRFKFHVGRRDKRGRWAKSFEDDNPPEDDDVVWQIKAVWIEAQKRLEHKGPESGLKNAEATTKGFRGFMRKKKIRSVRLLYREQPPSLW